MELQLEGMTALVTGGAGGIGGEVVAMLAAEGCNVAFCSRSQANVDAMLERLSRFPVEVSARVLDVQDASAFKAWLK